MIINLKKSVRAMPVAILAVASSLTLLTACQGQAETKKTGYTAEDLAGKRIPGSVMDFSHWKITLPMDSNRDGKIDEVGPPSISRLLEPRFFYANEAGEVVFTAPNKAITTANSTNTRSELRQMVDPEGSKTKAPGNNFALAAHPKASRYGSIGGRLSATLAVNHVAVEAKNPNKKPAFSVVVGQIHAGKDEKMARGFGYGNEPLKIYYKKWPNHEHGSVFWTYERNLEKDDPNRTDIAYPVWGNLWDSSEDPGEAGVLLDQTFSYSVDVDGNVMNLTFESEGKPTVEYSVDLSNNVDPNGKVDELDNPRGYSGDWFYYKAGAYNQCSSKDEEGMWYAGCAGTGVWEEDSQAGHYAQATFSSITLD
ncbi:polysaccharide lyase family 7 protein [Gilvimarinus agarilyticus]|uniref:polysaccharide lyase family 7 protein n=1 Tax=Gilvimarinus agarilyticus TaxID=679259 RepID=UPI0005A0D305|nr:polysaccharide lyase family 7 protein [Gilvimarinus agarilyticus]